jgi:hypothetical protein
MLPRHGLADIGELLSGRIRLVEWYAHGGNILSEKPAPYFAVQDIREDLIGPIRVVRIDAKRSNDARGTISDYFARDANHHGVIRNVLRYYGTSSDHAIVADRDARQHGCAGADARAVSHACEAGERGAAHDMDANAQDAFVTDATVRVDDAEVPDGGIVVHDAAGHRLYALTENRPFTEERDGMNCGYCLETKMAKLSGIAHARFAVHVADADEKGLARARMRRNRRLVIEHNAVPRWRESLRAIVDQGNFVPLLLEDVVTKTSQARASDEEHLHVGFLQLRRMAGDAQGGSSIVRCFVSTRDHGPDSDHRKRFAPEGLDAPLYQ